MSLAIAQQRTLPGVAAETSTISQLAFTSDPLRVGNQNRKSDQTLGSDEASPRANRVHHSILARDKRAIRSHPLFRRDPLAPLPSIAVKPGVSHGHIPQLTFPRRVLDSTRTEISVMSPGARDPRTLTKQMEGPSPCGRASRAAT